GFGAGEHAHAAALPGGQIVGLAEIELARGDRHHDERDYAKHNPPFRDPLLTVHAVPPPSHGRAPILAKSAPNRNCRKAQNSWMPALGLCSGMANPDPSGRARGPRRTAARTAVLDPG